MTATKNTGQVGKPTQLATDEAQQSPPTHSHTSSLVMLDKEDKKQGERSPVWGHPLENDDSFRWTLVMIYRSASSPKWEARITFYFKDLPKAMREGLFWSDKYCVPELGFCSRTPEDITWQDFWQGWTRSRRYILIDSERSQWYAKVDVLSDKCLKVLREFSLEQLNMETVKSAEAFNPDGAMVYRWRRKSERDENLNAIYGTMPMGGLWPWPKAPVDLREEVSPVKVASTQEPAAQPEPDQGVTEGPGPAPKPDSQKTENVQDVPVSEDQTRDEGLLL